MDLFNNEIKSLASELFKVFCPYFNKQIVTSQNSFDIIDSELGEMASACTTLEAALALFCAEFVFEGSPNYQLISKCLVKKALKRQHSDGALGQPFYIIRGKEQTKDIAEIGAAADALYYLYHYAKADEAKDILIGTAKFLLQMQHPSVAGVYYKRSDAKEHDVLNGDAYAGAALMRTYQVTNDIIYHDLAADVAKHLIARFGVHSNNWWPYAEYFDGSISVGNSLGYQATIVAFGHDILSGLKDSILAAEFSQVLEQGMLKVLECIEKDLPLKEVEPVWWAVSWNRCPEVLLALIKERRLEKARHYALLQLREIVNEVLDQGIDYFKPPEKKEADPNKTPVTTTFRKVATLAGILSYAIMDILEEDSKKNCNV